MTDPSPTQVEINALVAELRDLGGPIWTVKDDKVNHEGIAEFLRANAATREKAASVIVSLQGELAASERVVKDLSDELDNLEQEGCDTDDTIRKLEAELAAMKKEIRELKSENIAEVTRRQDAENELHNLTAEALSTDQRDEPPSTDLRDILERYGKTQTDLANLIGSRSRASEYLTGARTPTRKALYALRTEWGIPFDVLFGLSTDQPRGVRVTDAYRIALEKIANPVKWLKEYAAQNDRQLDGLGAITLSNDVEYLKSIAREALQEAPAPATEPHPLADFNSDQRIKPGLYLIHWKSGGTSEAAIGMLPDGNAWIAPTNWVRPSTMPSAGEWGEIERVERISPAPATEQRETVTDAPTSLIQQRMDELLDDQHPMSCEAGEITAAEDVLSWLIIEKCGAPDDQSYTPRQALKIIERKLDELAALESASVSEAKPVAWRYRLHKTDGWTMTERELSPKELGPNGLQEPLYLRPRKD